MRSFHLNIEHILQGDFTLAELNLFFIFQVNCPGCFLYGFPQMNRLYLQYRNRGLKLFGIATAFEDFEYNTKENVQLLISEQKTVGAVKAVLGQNYPESIEFPIAVDRLATGKELITDENLEFACQIISGLKTPSPEQKETIRSRLENHFQQMTKTSTTFSLNFLQGTPSFILCDKKLNILDQWFGHATDAAVISCIERCACLHVGHN